MLPVAAGEPGTRSELLRACENDPPLQAIAACDTLLELGVFDSTRQQSMVLVWRGGAYQMIGAFPQAVANFDRATAVDQTNAEAYVARALWRDEAGLPTYETTSAQYADLEAAMRHNPDHVIALLLYAMLLEQEWASEVGDDYLPRARRVAPEHPWLYFTLARIEAMDENGDWSLGQAQLNEAITRAPNNHLFRLYRGDTRRYRGDPAGSLADFDVVLLQRPWNFDAHFGRARTLDDLRRYDEAIDEYSAALLWREDAEALGNRCLSRISVGMEFHLARQDCERAARIHPDRSRVLGNLALALLFTGDANGAQIIASRAIAVDGSSRSRYVRYLIYKALGRENLAREDFEMAISHDADIARQMADIERWVPVAPTP